MSKLIIDSATLTDIADAIRTKTGTSEPMSPTLMATNILNIPNSADPVFILDKNTRSVIPNKDIDWSVDFGDLSYVYNCNNLPISAVYGYNVQSVYSSAFQSYKYLQEVDLPACKTLGTNAFDDCHAITYLNLPKCEFIGEKGLGGLYNLTSLSLPVCSFVGAYALGGMQKVTSLALPACETLRNAALQRNAYMTDLYLPVCKTINDGVFAFCERLVSLYLFNSTVTELKTHPIATFLDTPFWDGDLDKTGGQKGSVFVPMSLVDAYRGASNWSVISELIVGLTDDEIAEVNARFNN